MPERIQRKRTKGYRLPAGAVYVGRPSKWGNPFVVVPDDDGNWYVTGTQLGHFERAARDKALAYAVARFRSWLACPDPQPYGARSISRAVILRDIAELRGRDLACWCPLDSPCHADVLLELANGEDR
jgi:hypothetical protein